MNGKWKNGLVGIVKKRKGKRKMEEKSKMEKSVGT